MRFADGLIAARKCGITRAFILSMILSENRFPLFGIMLYLLNSATTRSSGAGDT